MHWLVLRRLPYSTGRLLTVWGPCTLNQVDCSNSKWATAGRFLFFPYNFSPNIVDGDLAAHKVGWSIWYLPELPEDQSEPGPHVVSLTLTGSETLVHC